MTQTGIVKQVGKNTAVVSIARKGACGENCALCGACKTDAVETVALTDIVVEVGDIVRVETADKPVYLGLFTLFVLPIFLPLGSYLLFWNAVGDTAGVIAAIVALCASGILIFMLEKNLHYLRQMQPHIVSKE